MRESTVASAAYLKVRFVVQNLQYPGKTSVIVFHMNS